MKLKILTLLITLPLLNLSCSGIRVTESGVKKELQTSADSIKKDKKSIYKLDDKIVGKKGYFYIIRNNGTISYHPRKALINLDTSSYPFVQRILKDRDGCLSFNSESGKNFIFFCEIDSNEILCMTIDSSEFSGPVYGCDLKKIEEEK